MAGDLTKLLSIPRNKWRVTAEDLKLMFKVDKLEMFPDLLEDFEYDHAICRAVLDYNGRPPGSNLGPHNFHNVYLLIKMAYVEVLNQIIIYHAQDYFTGESGGVKVPTHEQFASLQQIASIHEQKNERLILTLTRRKNTSKTYRQIPESRGFGPFGTW